MRTPITLIGSLAVLASCGDAGSNAASDACEQGMLIESGAGQVCVFRRDQALVIEGGFDCPEPFEFRFDTPSSIACSPHALDRLPAEVCAELPESCDSAEHGPQAGAGGESDSGSTCGRPAGTFDATYQLRSGDCGEVISTDPMPIDGGVTIEKFADRDVQTESVIEGCQLAFVQTVRNIDGLPTQQAQGSALTIDSPTQISGRVTLTRYDESGQPECSGEYDVVLTASTITVGRAAP